MGPYIDCSGFTYATTTNPLSLEDGHKIKAYAIDEDTAKMLLKNKPELNFKKYNFYEPKKIIYNGKATIVFWKDGTKTVVKMAEGTIYSKYNAFCAALAKKICGSNSAVNRTVANGIEQK